MKIGELREQENGRFSGFVTTSLLSESFTMERNTNPDMTRDFDIKVGERELGYAINKTDRKGEHYFDMCFDDPWLPNGLYCRAWFRSDHYAIEFNRPKRRPQPGYSGGSSSSSAAGPAGNEPPPHPGPSH